MKAKTDRRDDIALARHLATCAFPSTIKRGSKQSWLALLALILLVVLGTRLCSQAQTQDQAPGPARSRSAEMIDRWNDIGNKLIAMAQDFPEDKYDFKLQKDQRTFAENLLHAAALDFVLIRRVSGSNLGPDFGQGDNPSRDAFKTKADVVKFVQEAIADGARVIQQQGGAGLDKTSKFFGNRLAHNSSIWTFAIEHSGEHYGQLVVYYRANNLVPPDSRRDQAQQAQQPSVPRVVDLKAPDGTILKASYFAAAKPGPGVLLLHQFNQTRKAWDDLAGQLAAAGINTLTLDMRGFGESGGTPNTKLTDAERAKVRTMRPSDIDTAFQYLVSQPGVKRDVIGVGGTGELGVGQSVEVARQHTAEVKSLVLLSGEAVQEGLQFLRKASQLPELFVVADDDEYPPTVEAMELLYITASNSGKKFVHYSAAQEAPWVWYEGPDVGKAPANGGHGTDMFKVHPELPGIIVDWLVTTLIKTPGHAPADTVASAAIIDQIRIPRGVDQVTQQLTQARRRDPTAQLFPEITVSIIGQDHLRAGEPKLAVDILKLVLLAYPESADAHETLAEAYLADEQKDLARQHAEKALAILDSHTAPASSWTDTEQYRGEIRSGAQDVLKKLDAAATTTPAAATSGHVPGTVFRDCPDCPEMVVVPAGKFSMGSSSSEKSWAASHGESLEAVADESPQHQVSLRSFALGRYDVTRGEYAAFVRETGYPAGDGCGHDGEKWNKQAGMSWQNPGFSQTERDPGVCISWPDARAYISWLNGKVRRLASASGDGPYRLPSESEWEYAARGETTTRFWWGDDDGSAAEHAWYKGNSGGQTHPVGSKPANPFGLYDMVGDVWQWTEDCYADSYANALADGSASEAGNTCMRVDRGGSWFYPAVLLRPAARERNPADYRDIMIGFRLARTLP
jgi:formylglycine-generating enzyme required for sulfatase activity/dienelactone hydrolase